MADLSTLLLRVSLIALCLGGCAGNKTVQTPEELTAAANQGGPWFCQPSVSSQAWECDNDPEKVANPVPDRKPRSALPPPIAPSVTTPPVEPEPVTSAPSERVIATDDALPQQDDSAGLLALPANHYTVQLAAMSDGTDVAQYLSQLNTPGLSVATIEQDGERLLVLLLGTYESFHAAETASAALPDALSQFEPWIRRLGPLQAAILRGQQTNP